MQSWRPAALIASCFLLSLVDARSIAVHTTHHVCYDKNNHVIPCPTSKTKTIIICVVLGVVALVAGAVFLFIILRKKRRNAPQKYTQLPAPAPMGYAPNQGQPQTYNAPQLGYNASAAPQYSPYAAGVGMGGDKPYDPPAYPPQMNTTNTAYVPPNTAYAPPQGPPQAATHYGYSAGPI